MFITGPSIIEWLLVSPAPEAAAWSQWERRPFTVRLLLALVSGTNTPTLRPGVHPSPYSKLLSRDEKRMGCGPHGLLSLPCPWIVPSF